jgi:DNA-binding transcriptional ArsR family regulator
VVRLPPRVEERIDFTLSPMIEALLSLHVLRQPDHHPLNHRYVRRMRDWPAPLRRDLARFAFAFQNAPSAVGLPLAGVDRAPFADELAVLRRATDEQALAFFARTHYLPPGVPAPDPRCAPETTARFFGDTRRSRASLALAEQAVRRPRGMLLAFADVVERYWDTTFEEQWHRGLPRLEEAIAKARERLVRGLDAFLQPLWPEVRIDQNRRALFAKRVHDHEVAMGPSDRLRLLPSFFIWPHVRMYCERPGEVVLVHPPASTLARAAPIRPPSELLALLTALADDTRLRALHYLHEQPRSTQELSALVGVTASTLSEHLRKLESSGILRSRREGFYVLYEVAVDLGGLIRTAIDDYLGQPDATRPAPPQRARQDR